MTTTTLNTLSIVDEIGFKEEQIKLLVAEVDALKDQVKTLGAGTYVGDMFVTTITHTPEKKTVSWAKVAKEVNVPADIVDKHTTLTTNILTATTKPRTN